MAMMPRLTVLVFSALILTACGDNLPQTIRVSGRITFDGQPPPAPGSVFFLPTEAAEGFPTRPATGNFDKEGYFKATTFEPGDGVMPGKYVLSIESWEFQPNMSGNPGKSYVPKKYQSPKTSGFSLEITTKTKPQEIKLDVVTK
jgi:hypothetical protein